MSSVAPEDRLLSTVMLSATVNPTIRNNIMALAGLSTVCLRCTPRLTSK